MKYLILIYEAITRKCCHNWEYYSPDFLGNKVFNGIARRQCRKCKQVEQYESKTDYWHFVGQDRSFNYRDYGYMMEFGNE